MQIHPCDNVEVREDGQKYALCPIKAGENVIKYGFPIGHATKDIAVGEQVSPKNLRSNLSGTGDWTYTPSPVAEINTKQGTFWGYVRKNGDVGIRNELWIVPTVDCINDVAKALAKESGAKALTHPYGCSQLGGDLQNTQNFRQYFIDHGEGIADNPSPGNVAGGISTLEEKSLGCVQKAGNVPLCGALNFGEVPPATGGLYLVNGPGNDMVAVTALAASGAHMILFTTGRGTPLSGVVPTLKIATNTPLATKKPHWIDLNAGALLDGKDMATLANEMLSLCLSVANGACTKSEEKGYYDLAIFKDGVTL